MALWICRSCTAAYAVGLAACPQCGGTEHDEENEHMAKISKGSGPSYEPGKEPYGVPDEPETAPDVQAETVDETGAPSGTEAQDTAPPADTAPHAPEPAPGL